MNILTIIVLVLLALFMLRGYRKGFVKSLASVVSLLVSVVLVSFATPYVTGFLETQTPVYSYVLEKCTETFSIEKAGSENVNTQAEEKQTAGSSQLVSLQEQMIDAMPIPEILKNMLKENNTPEKYGELAVHSFNEYVPRFMAELIMNIISFVVTWILVISFIRLAIMTLDIIAGLPVIRGINQILGLGLGFIQGLVIVWIGLLIITIFSNTDGGRQLMNMISESVILRKMYDTNLLLDILESAVKNFL